MSMESDRENSDCHCEERAKKLEKNRLFFLQLLRRKFLTRSREFIPLCDVVSMREVGTVGTVDTYTWNATMYIE